MKRLARISLLGNEILSTEFAMPQRKTEATPVAGTRPARETQGVDMPPIPLMVLDSLADDWESIESMRDHGEVAPYGLALVDEGLVIDAVRALMGDGLVEVREVADDRMELVPVPEPRTDQASLRAYWFRPTDAGNEAWREGHDLLDAYNDVHPPGGAANPHEDTTAGPRCDSHARNQRRGTWSVRFRVPNRVPKSANLT